jgi:uncharacterized protein (TIGR00255 family)
MLKSMTGYGKISTFVDNKSIQVEIRSVNSKSFDFSSRVPNQYKSLEPEIRSLLQQKFKRGKVELTITEIGGENTNVKINIPLLKKHYQTVQTLAKDLNIEQTGDLLSSLLRIPELVYPDETEIDEDTWSIVFDSIEQAAESLDRFRISEGENLAKDFRLRINNIKALLKEIPRYEKERLIKLKERFYKNLEEGLKMDKFDANRFEQELIYYIEKLDITEEKVRLLQHLVYFEEVLNESNSQGKKLNFIGQEIGRELNTLGSKANHAHMQRLIVQMKDELEKIKEQLLNIL